MTAELGQLALSAALLAALLLAATPFFKGRNAEVLLAISRALMNLVAGLIAVAFLILLWLFWISDFSVALVAAHSSDAQPALYRLSAAWGNHEGSLLLWLLALAASGAWLSAAHPPSRNPPATRAMPRGRTRSVPKTTPRITSAKLRPPAP